MTRLAVSAEFIRPGRVGGAEQALIGLVDGLASHLTAHDDLVVVATPGTFPDIANVRIASPPRPLRSRFLQESMTIAKLRPRPDAAYFPNYFTPPSAGACRVVSTIHDLQYLHLPHNFSRRKRHWLRAAHVWTLSRAERVTVVSDFVRNDLMERYPMAEEAQVVTLSNAVSWHRFGESGHSSKRPYVLSVASHYHHKNLSTLVRAFAQVHNKRPGVELVLVGQFGSNLVGVSRSDDIRSLIADLGLDDVIHTTGYIATEELGAWYRGAELFVFPSIFEGFGLPPVEALGFGLPVITTRRTSLPEVTLGLAEYVDDPFDADELAGRIVEQLDSGQRPTAETVARIREAYSPVRIGKQLYDLMTSPAS